MLIVKLKTSDFIFKYEGDIEVSRRDEFLCISANKDIWDLKEQDELEDLLIYNKKVYDGFFIEDVEYIRGE